jgi:pimeloyl-ACP methyl ester carboxylesterase
VTQPTLLVVGSEDRIVDPHQAVEAARLLPRGRLVVLEGCGHAPQIEQSDVVNRLVVEFIQESSPGMLQTSATGATAP